MIRWLQSLISWRVAFEAGAFTYFENDITGERRAVKSYSGYSALNTRWLEGANIKR